MIEPISTSAVGPRNRKAVGFFLPRPDRIVIGWIVAIKVLLFLFGAVAFQVLENKRVVGIHGLLGIWNRWDAPAYQRLAQFGYSMTGEFKSWFYPMLPWTQRLVAFFCRDYVVSAFLVSAMASVAAAMLLRRVVELDFSPRIALRSVWFFLIFPTSYFLHVGYTESLFLSLALGCILAARTQWWWVAGLLGGLACMTRANGLVLGPTLAVEIVQQYLSNRRLRWQWLWIGLIPLGFGVYLFNNWLVAGNAFAFLQLRKELFSAEIAWPGVGVRNAIASFSSEPAQDQIFGAQEIIFTALGFAGTIATWIKLRPLYGMWMSGNWLLCSSVTFLSGMPRYTLVLFPIYVLFALLASNRIWNALITVWSLFFLALFSSLFAWGHWAF